MKNSNPYLFTGYSKFNQDYKIVLIVKFGIFFLLGHQFNKNQNINFFIILLASKFLKLVFSIDTEIFHNLIKYLIFYNFLLDKAIVPLSN